MTRLKDLCDINPGVATWSAIPDDEPLPFLPMERVWTDRLNLSELRPKSEVASGYTRFAEGDLLLPKITPTFEAARASIAEGLPEGVGAGTTELHVLRPRPNVHPRWLLHFLNHQTFLQKGHADMYGVAGQKRISDDFVKGYPVDPPSLEEQQRIADYLDAETARIDELIAEQVQLMRLLDDRLNVYIAQAVVGADVAGRKVASQVPWWPALPVGWETWKLARACGGITVGVVVNPSTYVDEAGEVPFIRGTDVRPWHIAADSAQRMTVESNRLLAKSTLRAGDLVVVRVGAPGTAAVVPDELDGANCASLLILRRGPADPGYLAAVLNSSVGRDQIRCMSNGAAQEQVNAGDIAHLVVPFPPLDDQRRVADSVQRERTDAARITAALDHQIDLLQEHRQALITHAVTHGIDGLPGVA